MSDLANVIDTTELKTKGLQIIRQFFPETVKRDLRNRVREIIQMRDAGALTTYDQDSQGLDDEWFRPLVYDKGIVDLMVQIIGPNVGAKGYRVLAKDKHFKLGVHVHQDFPYNSGGTDKLTLFVPLTRMNAANGGLIFYEGSHQYGPVSKGPLDVDRFPPMPEICPDVDIGDLIICDYLTWHYSNPSDNGEERVLLQLNYQPADDASSNTVVAGKRSHDKLLFSRFDAARLPSVELNCKTAQEFLDKGDVERATRYARGLLYDDADHSGAALLLCDVLAQANDPGALQYLEQARASLRKQLAKVAAFDRRYGLDTAPLLDGVDDGAADGGLVPAPWRSLDLAFHSKVEGHDGAGALPASLVTSDQPWGYGAVSHPIDIRAPATIRIKARAAKGHVGFCLIRADDGSLVSEQLAITPESGDATVMIAASADHPQVELVVRNFGDTEGAGKVDIASIDILEYS